VYLIESEWSLSKAVEAYRADVAWELTQKNLAVAATTTKRRTTASTTAVAAPQEFEMETLITNGSAT
jgi:hypothetical protein